MPHLPKHDQEDSQGSTDLILTQSPRFAPLNRAMEAQEIIAPEQLTQWFGMENKESTASLIQVLIAAGLLSPETLRLAKEQKKIDSSLPLWKILLELGILGERSLAMGLAITLNLPFIDLQPTQPQNEAIRRMDGVHASLWEALPLKVEEGTLLMVTADPKLVDLSKAETLAGMTIRLCLAPRSKVLYAIDYWYGGESKQEYTQPIGQLDLREMASVDFGEHQMSHSGSAVELLNQIIWGAVQKRASDIHVIPDNRFVRVYFRIDGKLFQEVKLPLSVKNPLVSRIKVVAGMDIAEKRMPQDGTIQVRMADRFLDIRVSDVPSIRGETIVLRLLDLQVGLVELEDLGFLPSDLQRFQRSITQPYGLILVTGPTGSGKSTTLRAALDHIVQHQFCHVLSVEDPVEVKMDRVTQVQVNPRTGFDFPRALRQFLRHDPDVIMVGEIRDSETAKISVQAALTGHLVFSTLHTNDAPGAVTRLLDMGVEPFLVSSAINLVIAQRLVRLLCPACRRPHDPSPQERRLLRSMGHGVRDAVLYSSPGCGKCNRTGFIGRTVIYEMLSVDEELKNRIARQETATMLRRVAMQKGFKPLMVSGLQKVLQGQTSLAEVAGHVEFFMSLV